MNYIRWCNDNNGFLTAILSLIGLTLSATAIVVSIRTARLPYKKRIMVDSYLTWFQVVPISVSNHPIPGRTAVATNVGNKTVNLTYLGYVVKKMEDTMHCTQIQYSAHASLSLTVNRPLLLPKRLRAVFMPMN